MAKVKAGELEHLNELFSRYSKRLYNYFVKSLMDRAESDDLTQELFLRVMKYRGSYNTKFPFQVWLFQIARNLVKDHFRKMKVHKDQFNPVEVIPETSDEEDRALIEKEELLYRAMSRLSDEKRELLVLSKFQKMKYETVARIRETTVANVKVQVHRAIKELRDIYLDLEIQEL